MNTAMKAALSRLGQCVSQSRVAGSFFVQFQPTRKISRNAYALLEVGTPNAADYRAYFIGDQGLVSPFHDIPLYANGARSEFNMVVEIPRWTNAKMEICKEERLNPLKQDLKNGKVRFVQNVHPYHGYLWNYGAFPQTWEDPEHIDSDTNAKGDNDPLDVCEIGSRVQRRGAVIRVKVLGVLGLIDEGESDWKVVAIDVTDPIASRLNDINDVETVCPGLLADTLRWFTLYKIPAGKGANKFAFNGKFRDAKFTRGIINQANEFWKRLHAKDGGESLTYKKISLASRMATNANLITDAEARAAARAGASSGGLKPAAPVDEAVNKTYFINNDAITNK